MNERIRKVSVELTGDSAKQFDTLKVALGLDTSGPKRESDANLVSVALEALEHVMSEYRKQTGHKYPSSQQLMAYIEKGELPLFKQ